MISKSLCTYLQRNLRTDVIQSKLTLRLKPMKTTVTWTNENYCHLNQWKLLSLDTSTNSPTSRIYNSLCIKGWIQKGFYLLLYSIALRTLFPSTLRLSILKNILPTWYRYMYRWLFFSSASVRNIIQMQINYENSHKSSTYSNKKALTTVCVHDYFSLNISQ